MIGPIDAYMVEKTDLDIAYAEFVCGTNAAFSIVNSAAFQNLLTAHKARGHRYKRSHNTSVSIPKYYNMMKEFLIDRLKGKDVCLIVDEMAKYDNSFFNYTLSTVVKGSDNHHRPTVFFWESRVLRDSTAISIGASIVDVAEELSQKDIHVLSFCSDNCNTMKKTVDYTTMSDGRVIIRVGCGSHVLNNIIKDIMDFNCLASLWKKVKEEKLQ